MPVTFARAGARRAVVGHVSIGASGGPKHDHQQDETACGGAAEGQAYVPVRMPMPGETTQGRTGTAARAHPSQGAVVTGQEIGRVEVAGQVEPLGRIESKLRLIEGHMGALVECSLQINAGVARLVELADAAEQRRLRDESLDVDGMCRALVGGARSQNRCSYPAVEGPVAEARGVAGLCYVHARLRVAGRKIKTVED